MVLDLLRGVNVAKFSYNLRFPGQYYDAETGKHYNYFRDYDPGIGRYLESDPIGMLGGLNTYRYASASPLTNFDPLGLADCTYSISRHVLWGKSNRSSGGSA